MQGVEIEEDSSSGSIYSSFAADFLLTQEQSISTVNPGVNDS